LGDAALTKKEGRKEGILTCPQHAQNEVQNGNNGSNRVTEAECVEIYEAYPRKSGRRKALEAIRQAIKRGNDRVKMLEATKVFAQSPAGNNGRFVPLPTTWFNQDRFLDDSRELLRCQDSGQQAGLSLLEEFEETPLTPEQIEDLRHK